MLKNKKNPAKLRMCGLSTRFPKTFCNVTTQETLKVVYYTRFATTTLTLNIRFEPIVFEISIVVLPRKRRTQKETNYAYIPCF